MGGMGSGGCWSSAAKDTTDDHGSIDVRRWQRQGLLIPNQSFDCQWSRRGKPFASIRVRTEPGQIILIYRHRSGGEDWQDESYPIRLDRTPCHFGGDRPWFLCPAMGCGRRVAILYSGDIFACRHCHQLPYPSQRETTYDRALRRADRIRDTLGWQPGVLTGRGRKPKGMHWTTFQRLTAQHDAFVAISLTRMSARFDTLDESLVD